MPSLMAPPYHRIQGIRAPQIKPATDGPRGTMPKSRHRKNAPASPHHARPRGIHARGRKMTHHDSLSGDANPQMTQNDSLFQASSPQMTQNDSLFQASMPQMSQNDSHIEVFSFEMSQNDSFSGLKWSHRTPPSPWLTSRQRPRLSRKMTHPFYADNEPGVIRTSPVAAGPLPSGPPICRFVLRSAHLHHEQSEESHPPQRDSSPR